MSDDPEENQTPGADEEAPAEKARPDPPWLTADVEWGIRARPDAHGLRFSALNLGTYGEVPAYWDNKTEIPRGAIPNPAVEKMPYSIYDKAEVWSDLCADLYEEAIQRRWSSSEAVPWDSLSPLDADVERAVCQLATALSEYGWMKAQTVGRWLQEISYGFIEVKLFLSTVVFDSARLFEVFRKRALANGGGLGRGGRNIRLMPLTQSLTFSEYVVALILHDSFTLTLLGQGARLARNPAEATIYRLCGQDIARHLSYATDHMRYLLLHEPDRREEIHRYLNKAEYYLAQDGDDTVYSALAVLLANGREPAAQALPAVAEIRRGQVEAYLSRLETARLGDRRERLHNSLKAWAGIPLPEPA
ncbi:MAG: hypothetical protein V3V06_01705 [Dehalococcoidia bacterium]